MNALFRKECRGMLNENVVAGVLGGIGLAAMGRYVLDYGPPTRDLDEGGAIWVLFCMAAGTTMGFWQLREERTKHTEAYLHHRATGPTGAFVAKVVAGLLGLALILGLELFLHGSWFFLFSEVAPLARPERVLDHLALASVLVSSYGLGLWTSSMPRTEATRLMMLFVGAVTLYLVSALLSLRWGGVTEAPVARYVLGHLAIGAVLGVLAWRLQVAGGEPERPLRTSRWLPIAVVVPALFFFGFPLATMPTGLQRGLRDVVLEDQPTIVLDKETGELMRVVRGVGGWFRADADGAPLPDEPVPDYDGWAYKPEHPYLTVFDPDSTPLGWGGETPPPIRRAYVGDAFSFDGPYIHVRASARGPEAAWYDRARRNVLALSLGPDGEPRQARLERPGGFSSETRPLFDGDGGACLVDRADATAWRLDGETLVPAPLPEGRLLDVERVHGRWRVAVGLLEPYGYSDSLVARGTTGLWTWTPDGWVPWESDPGDVVESDLPGAWDMRLRAVDDDALLPRLEVLDAETGEVILAHDYTPRTAGEWAAYAGTLAHNVVRPPLASLVALTESPAAFDRTLRHPADRLVLDPALAGGNRPWLALASWVVALLLARSVWVHLGASPEDRSRRVIWTALVALLGIPAMVALAFVEPTRPPATSREASETPDAAHRPVIMSGA